MPSSDHPPSEPRPGDSPPSTAPNARAAPLRAHDPRRIGPYEVLGLLGEGGMGVVYLGRGGDGRLVAIKVVRGEYARNAEFRGRFQREADSALRVPRFCTAEVLDANPDADQPYLVTEFIDGPTLQEVVDAGGPLQRGELEQLGVSMAAALRGIHGTGVIHRDLKPSNVLLSRLGPRVIDFGIASALDAAPGLTATGQAIGTPAFMAPEQLDGRGATQATDVFAWGGVMAYAATGRRPFGGGPSQTMGYRIVHGEPDLSGIDGGLRDVIAATLHKNPAQRPNAGQLLDMLGVPGGDPMAAVQARLADWTRPDPTRPYTQPPPGPPPAPRPYGPATMPAEPGARRPSSGARKGLLWGGIAAGVVAIVAAALLIVVPKLSGGTAEEIEGRWSGQYGNQYLLVDGKTVRMYYPSRNGRVQGTLDGDVIRGWWVEGTGTEAGGRADFRIVHGGAQLKLDGAWSFGAGAPASEWDLTRVDGAIPDSAKAKLADPTNFPSPAAN
jgi:serine/threonine protein kinase